MPVSSSIQMTKASEAINKIAIEAIFKALLRSLRLFIYASLLEYLDTAHVTENLVLRVGHDS